MNMFWKQYDTISLLPPHMDTSFALSSVDEHKCSPRSWTEKIVFICSRNLRKCTILFLDFRFVVFLPLLFLGCCFNKKRQPA